MHLPTSQQCFNAIAVTWPPKHSLSLGPWTLRLDPSGSSRVCAATLTGAWHAEDITTATAAMLAAGQQPLFMIRDQDVALDDQLARLGYQIKDPVNIYAAPVSMLAQQRPPPVSVFEVWPPLAVQTEIWVAGGIGPGRCAIMDRAPEPKTTILGRVQDRPAGSLFVGIGGDCAMVHALEITAPLRRHGLARYMIIAAAFWARANGAEFLTLVVTRANAPAQALYTSLGMQIVGQYHYRIPQESDVER